MVQSMLQLTEGCCLTPIFGTVPQVPLVAFQSTRRMPQDFVPVFTMYSLPMPTGAKSIPEAP